MKKLRCLFGFHDFWYKVRIDEDLLSASIETSCKRCSHAQAYFIDNGFVHFGHYKDDHIVVMDNLLSGVPKPVRDVARIMKKYQKERDNAAS